MPFITYKISKKFFENYKKIKTDDLTKFNTDLDDFNLNQKAILIINENNNVKEQLGELINKISNDNMDISLSEKKVLFENTLYSLNQSIEYKIENQNNIHIDFEKDIKKQIDRNLKVKIIEGKFYPEDYNDKTDDFIKNFLGKLEVYIGSKSKIQSDKINTINIYHKELSNYLIPIPDSIYSKSLKEFKNNLDFNDRKDKFTFINMKKIEYGVNLLFKWWEKLAEDIRPNEFNVITDIPPCLKKKDINVKEISMLEAKIEEFLFINNDKKKNKAKVKIIKQHDMPGYQGWKHKRHWILGKKINRDIKKENINFFAIKSDFGVEIVDPNNNSRLSKEMELTIINNKNTKQMRDITEYLFEDAKKIST